jgi:ArsR family transcriptional regulator
LHKNSIFEIHVISELKNTVLQGFTMKHLAKTIKALSDPIRLRIVHLLQAEGELCVCDLMEVLDLPQSTVSRHLAYLKRSCWVDTRREGVWMYYRISNESCDICRKMLLILKEHAAPLPEALSDRSALAAFMKDKETGCP